MSLGMYGSAHVAAGGGFTDPSDLPSIAGWWDASDASTFTYSSGSLVSEWRDKSGNARHFAQADTSKQPSRSGTQNSLDTLIYDGTNDYLDTASFTLSQPFTLVYVCEILASNAILSGVGGNVQTYLANDLLMFAGSSEVTVDTTFSGVRVYGFTFDGASSVYYEDGIGGTTTGSPGTSGLTTGLRTAERNLVNYPNNEIMEIVAVDDSISPDDWDDLYAYLTTKWGI